MIALTIHDTYNVLTEMRNAGLRVRLAAGDTITVGPAALITEVWRELIKTHRDNLLRILISERAAEEILLAISMELAEFDARPAKYRSRRQITEIGSAIGYTQADFDAMARKKGVA